MLFSDFLIGALILIVSITTATYGNSIYDAAPIPDEQHLGKDKCCWFEYKLTVKIDKMKDKFPAAEKIDLGRLLHHRLDFAKSDVSETAITTVVPDEAEEVHGMVYKSSVGDSLAYVEKLLLPRKKQMHLVITTVEVTIDGEIQRLQCNTLVAVNQPPKETPLPVERRPSKTQLDNLLQAFKDAGLPSAYITKVSEIPTRDG